MKKHTLDLGKDYKERIKKNKATHRRVAIGIYDNTTSTINYITNKDIPLGFSFCFQSSEKNKLNKKKTNKIVRDLERYDKEVEAIHKRYGKEDRK